MATSVGWTDVEADPGDQQNRLEARELNGAENQPTP